MTVAGLAVHMAGKNWFLDRMVWHNEIARKQAAARVSGASPVSPVHEPVT